MKNKSLILFVALLVGLSSLDMGCISSHANEISQNEETMRLIIEDANSYIAEQYGIEGYYPSSIIKDGIVHKPSISMYKKYRFICYYSAALSLESINPRPVDKVIVKPGDKINTPGEILYRYVGYDVEGRLLVNPNFPPDNLGSKPDESGLSDWGNHVNQDWLNLIRDKKRVKAKEAVEANFKKSVISTVDDMIGLYFLYHDPPFQNTKAYREAWVKLFERMFQPDLNTKIDVVLLPSRNAYGIAVFRYNSGYYTVAYLKYQEKTDAALRIHHVVVEGEKGAYRVSEGFHPINSHNEIRVIRQGEKITIKAQESEAYTCLGHILHSNLDKNFRPPAPGDEIGPFLASSEFNYIYRYHIKNDEPHLVFYYTKNKDLEVGERSGRIVVSSPKYDVPKAIPTDEDVKIEAYIDDADLAYVKWGGGEQGVSVAVVVNGLMNSGLTGYFIKDVEYYKLHHHLIYKFNRVLVKNPKLDAQKPIVLVAPAVPKAEARIYSRNVLGLHLPYSYIGAGGQVFRISLSAGGGGTYSGAYGELIGSQNLVIQLTPILFNPFAYLSDSAFRSLMQRLKASCKVKVRNDFLSIAGSVISSDAVCYDRAPKPAPILPRPIVLVKPKHYIENSALNGDSLTTGSLIYEKELGVGSEQRSFEIEGNNVFIHTPALNSAEMQDVSAFDQRTELQKERDVEKYAPVKYLSLPLDHVTEFELSTRGMHIAKKGYGDRDYEEHLKAKLIKLPFDAYVAKSAHNIEAAKPQDSYFFLSGSLITLEPRVKKIYIKAAPWVREGLYHLKTYAVAENAPPVISYQSFANLDFHKDAAERDFPVLVSGRIFDFAVEKVLDPAYLSTDDRHFWDGGILTKDSKERRRFSGADEAYSKQWTLPLTAEKSPYKHKVQEGVKLGYPLVFSVKSMGSFFTKDDLVVFKPKFYHIGEDGRVDEKIALFYKRDGALVRLGSEEDKLRHYAIFKSFAGLDNQELIRDSGLLYAERAASYKSEGGDFKLDALISPSAYMSRITKPVFISKPGYTLSSPAFRVFTPAAVAKPPGVSRERAGMSVQKWYGSYHLPSSTLAYALDEEGKPNFNKRLSGGSLGLSFDIGIARYHNEEGLELSYLTDSYNGWKIQKYQGPKSLPEGLIVLYSMDKSMDGDYIIK